MIATAITEGRGNQMFHYAVARARSLDLGVPLGLDLRWFDHGKWEYELGRYAVAGRPLTEGEAERWLPTPIFNQYFGFNRRRWYERVGNRLRLGIVSAGRRRLIHYHGMDYFERAARAPDGSYLMGNWENERYFERHADVLRRDLVCRTPLSGVARVLANRMANAGCAVALHVRRGDKVDHTGGICGSDYYRAALDYLQRRVRDARVFVFSDDLAEARRLLAHQPDLIFADEFGATEDWEDFELMRRCRHLIIANSTFSWWAAWLAAAPDKIVIAPEIWHLDQPEASARVVPAHWTRL